MQQLDHILVKNGKLLLEPRFPFFHFFPKSSRGIRASALQSQGPRFKPYLHRVSWASYLNSLNLSFPTCQWGF